MRKTFSTWLLTTLIVTSLAAEARSGARSPLAGGCPSAASATAYVCCDGAGGFTVCAGRPGGARVLLEAVQAHELDHLSWFGEHAPSACDGKRAGSCQFQMTPSQRNDLECRGYRAEFRALNRALAGASPQEVGDILSRQRTLERDCRKSFGCRIAGEDKTASLAALPE